jgi:phosphatidylserine decarboxylase
VTRATYAFAQLIRVLPRARITRVVGHLCDLELPPAISRAVVGAYARAYRVELDEAEPLNGFVAYPSFDAFFTRRLRNGAREITAPAGELVSPADGRLDDIGRIEQHGLLAIKGRHYRAADLLGDERDGEAHAARYLGGQFAIIYLSPRDYHRVHAPIDGALTEVRSYPGELYPVNGISEAHIPNYLGRNRRVAMRMQTRSLGEITVVMVAAMIVGRITVTGIDARDVPFGVHGRHIDLARGDELGIFHLGSTAVIFLEPRAGDVMSRRAGPIKLGEAMRTRAEDRS